MAAVHALEIISASDLILNKHLLLKYFIEGAVDSDSEANYLTSTLNLKQDVEPQLIRFSLDWRKLADRLTTFDPIPKYFEDLLHERDGPRCFLANMRHKGSILLVESARVIPPTMVDGIESAKEVGYKYYTHDWQESDETTNNLRCISDAFLCGTAAYHSLGPNKK